MFCIPLSAVFGGDDRHFITFVWPCCPLSSRRLPTQSVSLVHHATKGSLFTSKNTLYHKSLTLMTANITLLLLLLIIQQQQPTITTTATGGTTTATITATVTTAIINTTLVYQCCYHNNNYYNEIILFSFTKDFYFNLIELNILYLFTPSLKRIGYIKVVNSLQSVPVTLLMQQSKMKHEFREVTKHMPFLY